MTTPSKPVLVSAQVVVKDPADAAAAVAMFRKAGFSTGPLVANNFSIAGSRAAFERLFGVALTTDVRRGTKVVTIGGQPELELPLDALPPEISGKLRAVLFTEPPDFGPGGQF